LKKVKVVEADVYVALASVAYIGNERFELRTPFIFKDFNYYLVNFNEERIAAWLIGIWRN